MSTAGFVGRSKTHSLAVYGLIDNSVNGAYARVCPGITLKSNLTIKSGYGTSAHPYVIE